MESEPGAGSTFWFTTRFRKAPQKARPGPGAGANLRGLRVLVVDDNVTSRNLVHELISSWGMRGHTVGNGREALARLGEAAATPEPYGLVIIDTQMPGMDGLELVRRIKNDPKLTSIRLVALACIGEREASEQAAQAGVDSCVTKPVRQSRLYDAIANAMGMPK